MNDFNSLDNIFGDDMFDELSENVKPAKVVQVDTEIEKFIEIVEWSRKNNGKEPEKSRDMTERKFASRLTGIRKKPEQIQKLKAFDEFNWLVLSDTDVEAVNYEDMSFDDILDDPMLDISPLESSLFNVSRYKRTIDAKDKMSTRKRMGTNFEKYKMKFKKVHSEIANGKRQIKPFSGNRVSARSFYIYNGVMLYLKKIYHPKTLVEIDDCDDQKKYKIHVVYENGTENKNMWAESLITTLYNNARNGKIVTDMLNINDFKYSVPETSNGFYIREESAEYTTTGFVYVVRYAGNDERLLSLKNLYKIGYANDVKRRISNTVNQATYLFAPVTLVADFEVQNISGIKVEKYLHDVFSDCRLEVDMEGPNGKKIDATEWYVVELDRIKDAINELVTKIQI